MVTFLMGAVRLGLWVGVCVCVCAGDTSILPGLTPLENRTYYLYIVPQWKRNGT